LPPSTFYNKNLYAIDFYDNITGIIVGANASYFKMLSGSVDTYGYLTSTSWDLKDISSFIANPFATTNSAYDVAFASATNIVVGGHRYALSIFDAGERYCSRFYYDRLGRLVLSRNARQEEQNRFSYTLYD